MEFETVWEVLQHRGFVTLLALSVLYVFVKLFLRPDGRFSVGQDVNNQHSKTCSSPNCVRCSVYSTLLSKAEQCFRMYVAENGGTGTERLQENFGKSLDKNSLQQPNVLYVPYLTEHPFWSTTDSTILDQSTDCLKQQHHAIVKEYEDISSDLSVENGWKTNTTDTGHWNTFYLYNQGVKVNSNCLRCPVVTGILESSLESVFMKDCVFGNAFFSCLAPGTTISEHYGPCNVRLRIHLGVTLSPGWELTVCGRTELWREGQCLVFDDSYLHSVNYSRSQPPTGSRVVLIVDVWHPDLTAAEREAIGAVYNMDNCH